MGTGEVCNAFLQAARSPLLFLVRDPRRTIESRLRRVARDLAKEKPGPELRTRLGRAVESRDYGGLGDVFNEDVFPLDRTGWRHLDRQLRRCRKNGIGYRILDASDFRERPGPCLRELCRTWKLDYEENMLEWSDDDGLTLGGMGEQEAWYRRVLQSKGVEAETDSPISPDRLPERFRDHLPFAVGIYEATLADPRLIR